MKRNIALVAHDNKKQELLEWALFNRGVLAQHDLYATGRRRPSILVVLPRGAVFKSQRLGVDFHPVTLSAGLVWRAFR